MACSTAASSRHDIPLVILAFMLTKKRRSRDQKKKPPPFPSLNESTMRSTTLFPGPFPSSFGESPHMLRSMMRCKKLYDRLVLPEALLWALQRAQPVEHLAMYSAFEVLKTCVLSASNTRGASSEKNMAGANWDFCSSLKRPSASAAAMGVSSTEESWSRKRALASVLGASESCSRDCSRDCISSSTGDDRTTSGAMRP